MPKKITKEIFLERAKEQHGNKYDYSKVEYINTKIKVCIICPEHGEFWQSPEVHTKGSGCPKCACNKLKKLFTGKTIKTLDPKEKINNFIKKAKVLHSNKYNYSKVSFKRVRDKVEIICPKHGSFFQSVHHHLQGSGCPKCADENRSNSYKLTREQFIEKALEVHGDKYDYSLVENPKFNERVTIICPIHGEFQQFVNNHLLDCGCPKCSKHYQYNTEEFIKRAKEIHGDKYDYSKTKYINARTKVTIICPTHGEFEQLPQSHLCGIGCHTCSSSKGEKLVSKILKELNLTFVTQKRIEVNKQNLIVDFYLELNNHQYIIEYNGKQHYEPIKYFGGEDQFKKQQLRDILLRNYCKLYDIKLLEIAYNDINIEDMVKNFLKCDQK